MVAEGIKAVVTDPSEKPRWGQHPSSCIGRSGASRKLHKQDVSAVTHPHDAMRCMEDWLLRPMEEAY